MNKQEQDLLYYQNKYHQLEQLLEVEREKNLSLRKLLAKIRFTALPFLRDLEKL